MKRKILSLIICLSIILIGAGHVSAEGAEDAYVFSDDSGFAFVLVDENYVPVSDEAAAIGAAVYSCSLTESSCTVPGEAVDPGTGKTWTVAAIHDYALKDNESFEKVTISDSVKVIGKGAFSGCKALASITIPSGVEVIREEAFASCKALTAITFKGKPDIAANTFTGVKATAYYPLSWSEAPASNAYGGELKWVPVIPKLSNLKAVSASYNSARISWSKMDGVDGYIVYRKNGKDWKRLDVITATSYAVKNLNCGTTYTFTVLGYKKVDGKEVKGDYDRKGVSAKIVPATVKLGEAAASGTSIKITWSKVAGADGYYVYHKKPKEEWERIAEVGGSVTSYTDKGLNAGQYIYTLRAYRKVDGKKIAGNHDKKGISACITPAVPKLTGASGSVKNLTVRWGQIAGADGYRIYRRSSTSENWTRLEDISGGDKVSYKDTTVGVGNYYYTVRAYITKTDGKNVWSGFQKPGLRAVICQQPKMLSAVSSKSKGEARITVKWEAVPNAEGYRIYRKIDNGEWKLYTTKSSDVLSIVDNKVSTGVIYTYTVRAYVKSGNGQVLSTHEKGIKAVGYMDAPEMDLAVEWYDETCTTADWYFIWDEIENTDGYILYIKEKGDKDWTRVQKLETSEVLVDDGICMAYLEEIDLSDAEYLFTVCAYKTVDGKEVKGAYNKKGVSTYDAIDLTE